MRNFNPSPFGYFPGKGKIKKAFTLVELIVVITILAILGTIAFMSFQGYSRDSRDSVRLADLSNIHKQLELMLVKAGTVYMPENKVDITASGTVILYQGEMGQDTLNKLKVNNGGLDPVDKTPYTYSTTKNLKQYELMGFLENGNKVAYQAPSKSPHPNPLPQGIPLLSKAQFTLIPKGEGTGFASLPWGEIESGFFPQANAISTNLTNRFPITKGDSIGIILNPATNSPIQSTGTGVDIVNTNTNYKVYLDNSSSGSISGTGNILKNQLAHVINPIGSCNSILKNGQSKGDGIYKIDPNGTGSFDAYCDMTTDGGGYTRYLNIKSNYSYNDAKNCWLGKKINNKDIECFNPNRFKMNIFDNMMIKIGGLKYFYSPLNKSYSVNKTSSSLSYNCLGNINYMTVMSSDNSPVKLDLSNVTYIYLGVNYCVNNRGIGGLKAVGAINYMNYSIGGVFGPHEGNREPNVEKAEIFIR